MILISIQLYDLCDCWCILANQNYSSTATTGQRYPAWETKLALFRLRCDLPHWGWFHKVLLPASLLRQGKRNNGAACSTHWNVHATSPHWSEGPFCCLHFVRTSTDARRGQLVVFPLIYSFLFYQQEVLLLFPFVPTYRWLFITIFPIAFYLSFKHSVPSCCGSRKYTFHSSTLQLAPTSTFSLQM